MAAVLSVLNIKRNTEYETALQVIKSANEYKELLLLMLKCFVRSLLDQLLPGSLASSGSAWKVSQFGTGRKLPAFGPSRSHSPEEQGKVAGVRSNLRPSGLLIPGSHTTPTIGKQ